MPTREKTLAAVLPRIYLPSDTAILVIAPVLAPPTEGESDDAGAAVPQVEVVEAPRGSASHGSAPHGSAPRGSAPPAAAAGPVALPVVLPAMAHAAREGNDAGRCCALGWGHRSTSRLGAAQLGTAGCRNETPPTQRFPPCRRPPRECRPSEAPRVPPLSRQRTPTEMIMVRALMCVARHRWLRWRELSPFHPPPLRCTPGGRGR